MYFWIANWNTKDSVPSNSKHRGLHNSAAIFRVQRRTKIKFLQTLSYVTALLPQYIPSRLLCLQVKKKLMRSEREASAAKTTTIFTTWPNPNSDQIPARSFPQGRLTQSRVGAVRANLQMPSVRLYVRTSRHLRRLHKILSDSWRASLPPACAGLFIRLQTPR